MTRLTIALAASTALLPAAAHAQSMPGMSMPGMHHPAPAQPSPSTRPKPQHPRAPQPAQTHKQHAAPAQAHQHVAPPQGAPSSAAPRSDDPVSLGDGPMDQGASDHGTMPMDHSAIDHSAIPMDHRRMDHSAMPMSSAHDVMTGALGAYPMTRDGSGTSWTPESTPMMGPILHLGGAWSGMAHGFATVVADQQGGPRGAGKVFVASMLMGMAQRPLGAGTLTLKGMVSLDPLMGKAGYPLLLATGETADGRTALVDRQHPHDALAELSVTLSQPLGVRTSGFVYLAYPGEPALGPTTYLHRFSGMGNPEAPISHHYLDSTHVTFGVATAGLIHGPLKLEGSLFTGREPDQRRWDVEKPRFDSWSVRATLNPSPNWSLQVSHALLKSPEGLHPEDNVRRTTASATWNRPLSNAGNWQTTLAYGRNRKSDGHHASGVTQAALLESAVEVAHWGGFVRGEIAGKDELFGDGASNPLSGRTFTVGKLSLGGYRSLPLGGLTIDLGGLVSAFALPDALKTVYGSRPKAAMLFTRLRLGQPASPRHP